MPRVQTVLGSIPPSDLGITLTHEHILVDLLRFMTEPKDEEGRRLWNDKVRLETLPMIHRDPGVVRDNNVLLDENEASDELLEFKKFGGKSVVDVTADGIGRNPEGLQRIAKSTGLNIVVATGWYEQPSHPPFVGKMSVDQLTEIMVGEITVGIGQTGIRAGVMKGACGGPPSPWHPDERKVLTAICRAQRETGAPFTFHPLDLDLKKRARTYVADAYVDLIEREGAAKEKFYLSHADDTCNNLEYHRGLLDRGICLNYDCFGSEVYWEQTFVGCRNPSDAERVDAIAELCEQGYAKQLMLSHDICRKERYRRYGGYTFSHILDAIVPRLRAKGVTRRQIRSMLIDNPKRVFPF